MQKKPEALLLDADVAYYFDQMGFCSAFAKAAKQDDQFAERMRGVIFTGLYDSCNGGNIPFDWLYTKIVGHLLPGAQSEKLYAPFIKAWCDFFYANPVLDEHILAHIKIPMALLAVTNAHHAEKIRESDLAKRCKVICIHTLGPKEHNEPWNEIGKLANMLHIDPHRFLYLGNNPLHSQVAFAMRIPALHLPIWWNVVELRQQLQFAGTL